MAWTHSIPMVFSTTTSPQAVATHSMDISYFSSRLLTWASQNTDGSSKNSFNRLNCRNDNASKAVSIGAKINNTLYSMVLPPTHKLLLPHISLFVATGLYHVSVQDVCSLLRASTLCPKLKTPRNSFRVTECPSTIHSVIQIRGCPTQYLVLSLSTK